mgnify:CR=1 FL=1
MTLNNKTILVTRAASQAQTFRTLLEQQGARVIEMAALEIGPPSRWQPLDQAIRELSTFDWLILTSANGVHFFWERLEKLSINPERLQSLKIAVVGKKTARVLAKKGVQPTFIPPNFVADSLVETFPEPLSGQKILFPRVETGGRDVLIEEFQQQNAQVIAVPAYQSRCPEKADSIAVQALRSGQIDVITFASSKTVQCFCDLLKSYVSSGVNLEEVMATVTIASIGPQTSQACNKLLGKYDIEAKHYTLEGLTQAISEFCSETEYL